MWAVSFVFTRMVTLTLMFLAVGFGLARAENQGLDMETGNFNTVLIRSGRARSRFSIACLVYSTDHQSQALIFFFWPQDDCSTAGVFDPVMAALEVYPLPAEALEGVQTRTGCPQEERTKASPSAH